MSRLFRRGCSSRFTKGLHVGAFTIGIISIKWDYSHCDSSIPARRNLPLLSDRFVGNHDYSLNKFLFESLRKVHECWIAALRAFYLFFVFAPAVVTFPFLYVSSSSAQQSFWWDILRRCKMIIMSQKYHKLSSDNMENVLLSLHTTGIITAGPCPIKFSQWIATRPDLFPIEICSNLENLQSQASKGPSWEHTKLLLNRELGTNWEDKILLNEQVIGSGCVAYVLKGVMKSSGSSVAVKVISPGVKSSIETDLRIFHVIASLLEILPGIKSLSLLESSAEFESFMLNQLDLEVEAQNLRTFRNNFRQTNDHLQLSNSAKSRYRVTFPEPIESYSTKNVLVESFAEGVLMSDLLSADVATKRELAAVGLDTILKMIFLDNFIHADLHPGNIIVKKDANPPHRRFFSFGDGAGSHSYSLCMIDTGLVASLKPEDRRNFIDLFTAVIQNDGKLVGKLMIQRSRNKGCLDPEAFCSEIQKVVAEVHESGLSLGRISVGALLQRVLVACYQYQVKLEPRFITVVIAMGVLDGLGRRLDPNIDILQRAAPFVFEAVLRGK